MGLLSGCRWALAKRYRRASPGITEVEKWRVAFAVGAGLAGAGWGVAGILLYPNANLINQVFLVFVLGGMMLGAASILAPRPEAYLAFLVPTGFAPAIRFVVSGDTTHLAMGMLAAIFTLATVITTRGIYRTVDSALKLKFENRGLIEDLKTARDQTEALNQVLELRVEERTAELHKSTEQLRHEIVQREQVEEELLRARKLESLGVLAGGIAHDFNNFLTVIQGNVELARESLDSRHPAQEVLEETATACLRAASLSSQLLTFAKGGAPVRRATSVAKLVMDAVHLARAGAQISIDVNIAKDLRLAHVDAGQIGQVLQAILLNARQAMPEGGIIEVLADNVVAGNSQAGFLVRIAIRDYGCGIPAEILPRIFDPYFSTKSGAIGLGLATAHAIVAKHGGHISVESKAGNGTIITVDLPASADSAHIVTPQTASRPRLQTGTGRLLVMDDEQGVRTLLKTVLSSLGYEVQTARDGAEALALYEEAKNAGAGFDAVLLDLTVSGGMGGVEAAARLKEIDPSARLIVSSGYSDDPVMSDFAKYGFDAVIPKPWTAPELGEAFRKVLVADRERR